MLNNTEPDTPLVYELVPLTGPRVGAIAITAEEFDRLDSAKDHLVVFVGFEEKFGLLLENFAEYERTLLNIALQHSVFGDSSWDRGQDEIWRVNRVLANVLSAARSYLDQVGRELSAIFGPDAELTNRLKAARKDAYDQSLAYRAMEALRNHGQHRAFPVHRLSHPANVERDRPGHAVVQTVQPAVSVSELQKDKEFKQSVLAELQSLGDVVPITPMLREYVQGLASVHASLQGASASRVQDIEGLLKGAIVRAESHFGSNDVGFAAIRRRANDPYHYDEIQLFTGLIERRRLLQRRTRRTTSIARRHVSGRSEMPGHSPKQSP